MSLVEESRIRINKNRHSKQKLVEKNAIQEGKRHDVIQSAKRGWSNFRTVQEKMRTQFPRLDMSNKDFMFKEKKKK